MRSRLAWIPATPRVSGPSTLTVSPWIARRSCVATYSVKAASPLGMLWARADPHTANAKMMKAPQRRDIMPCSRDHLLPDQPSPPAGDIDHDTSAPQSCRIFCPFRSIAVRKVERPGHALPDFKDD